MFKKLTINQQIMIATVAIPFGIIEDIKPIALTIVQLRHIVLYTILYEFVLTLAACPHWYPLWLMRFTPFCMPLSLWITLHCYWNGYKRLAIAMAGCLVGHLHNQFKSPDSKAYAASLEAVKEIYQEAYDQMKDDSSKSLDGTLFFCIPPFTLREPMTKIHHSHAIRCTANLNPVNRGLCTTPQRDNRTPPRKARFVGELSKGKTALRRRMCEQLEKVERVSRQHDRN